MPRPRRSQLDYPHSALADAFKALAHPSRLEIIRHLAARNTCCAGDLCCALPVAQSTVSQHLEVLKSAGILDWRSEGTKSIFTLNRARLEELSELLAALALAADALNVEAADSDGVIESELLLTTDFLSDGVKRGSA